MIRKLKNPTHLRMRCYSSRIGTLAVVYKRAVIESQSHVRLVVAKDIIPRGLSLKKGLGQKECHPAPQHVLVSVEIASCENSDATCSESRCGFDGVKSINK